MPGGRSRTILPGTMLPKSRGHAGGTARNGYSSACQHAKIAYPPNGLPSPKQGYLVPPPSLHNWVDPAGDPLLQ
jgi:hypothetical protein